MRTRIFLTKRSRQDLNALEVGVARRIVSKLQEYAQRPDPLATAKLLSGEFRGLYRYRIGDYRVIFRKDAHGKFVVLIVLRIGHRKDIYE